MRPLTPSGQQAVSQIAQRHGFSIEAVTAMLDAVINGNGSMAQFSHPEFGGSGQWMSGGMTMLSDMFNNYLKGRVDNLCADLAALVSNQTDLIQRGSSQGQEGASLFAPAGPDWWGPELRWPDSSGAQNGVRYAYFSQAHRLAIEVNGQVTIYDTLDHQIGGVSQQQGYGGSLSFNSQYGLIDINRLPVLSIDGQAQAAPAPAQQPQPQPQPQIASGFGVPLPTSAPPIATASDIFTLIERLSELHQRGLLSDQEYGSKKAELLSRL